MSQAKVQELKKMMGEMKLRDLKDGLEILGKYKKSPIQMTTSFTCIRVEGFYFDKFKASDIQKLELMSWEWEDDEESSESCAIAWVFPLG
jgi:hypothetical protein